MMMTSPADFDFDTVLHIEQTFYDTGYADGHAHGRLHGLIEGRALGRQKGYELWEEIGFYEGFARFWQQALPQSIGKTSESRTESHIRHLLELIAHFPETNPNPDDPSAIDISALLNKIRARYKVLCASLGVKPRLRSATNMAGIPANVPDSVEMTPPPDPSQAPGQIWKKIDATASNAIIS